jgi:hypothetical protein
MIQEQNIVLLFFLKKREIRVQKDKYILLPPFQNVGHFDFSRFITFAMHLVSRCIANTMNLEKSKQPTFCNGGSSR